MLLWVAVHNCIHKRTTWCVSNYRMYYNCWRFIIQSLCTNTFNKQLGFIENQRCGFLQLAPLYGLCFLTFTPSFTSFQSTVRLTGTSLRKELGNYSRRGEPRPRSSVFVETGPRSWRRKSEHLGRVSWYSFPKCPLTGLMSLLIGSLVWKLTMMSWGLAQGEPSWRMEWVELLTRCKELSKWDSSKPVVVYIYRHVLTRGPTGSYIGTQVPSLLLAWLTLRQWR